MSLPFHEYVRQCLAGDTHITVPPAPQQLTGLRFQLGGETPIALFDDSGLRGLTLGALLTTHSLYMLDGRRIDVTSIRGGPYYPRGEDQPGYIDTTQGAFPFPAFSTDEMRSSFERLVEVAADYARGDTSSPYERLAARGPISHAVATTLLASPKVLPPWNIPRAKREGLRLFARGMDHVGGEEPLAVIDETSLGACDEGVLVTDRALHVRSETADERSEDYIVHYAQIGQVAPKSSVFGQAMSIMTNAGMREVKLITASEAYGPLIRFLGWLGQVPYHTRYETRAPSAPWSGDPLLVSQVTALKLPPEIEEDFRVRVHVQKRNELWGRGAREGWSLSPLSYMDLRYAITGVLGQPFNRHYDGRVETLDFMLRQGGSGVGGAVVSSAVGLALFATLGVGWISVPKGPTVTSIRLRGCDLPGGAGISVSGFASNREVTLPEIAERVDVGLVRAEHEILRRRCLMGPDLPVEQLCMVDEPTLAERAYRAAQGANPYR